MICGWLSISVYTHTLGVWQRAGRAFARRTQGFYFKHQWSRHPLLNVRKSHASGNESLQSLEFLQREKTESFCTWVVYFNASCLSLKIKCDGSLGKMLCSWGTASPTNMSRLNHWRHFQIKLKSYKWKKINPYCDILLFYRVDLPLLQKLVSFLVTHTHWFLRHCSEVFVHIHIIITIMQLLQIYQLHIYEAHLLEHPHSALLWCVHTAEFVCVKKHPQSD